MNAGKEYLVGVTPPPTLQPQPGGWAQVRFPDKTVAVSPIVTTQAPWAGAGYVHIVALAASADPTVGRDELVYRDYNGVGESRTISSFGAL